MNYFVFLEGTHTFDYYEQSDDGHRTEYEFETKQFPYHEKHSFDSHEKAKQFAENLQIALSLTKKVNPFRNNLSLYSSNFSTNHPDIREKLYHYQKENIEIFSISILVEGENIESFDITDKRFEELEPVLFYKYRALAEEKRIEDQKKEEKEKIKAEKEKERKRLEAIKEQEQEEKLYQKLKLKYAGNKNNLSNDL